MKKIFLTVLLTLALLSIVGNVGFAQCTCTAGCSSLTTTSMPFTKDGAGEICFQASSIGAPINSWNMDALVINGVSFTNVWADCAAMPAAASDGKYYIYYKGSYAWSHFEATGSGCSGGGATNPPADTTAPTNPPSDTAAPTATPGPTSVPTATPAGTPVPTNPPTDTTAPTNPPTDTTAPTTPPTETQGPTAVPGTHLDNPFSGAVWYINTEWSSRASSGGGSAIANCNTAVWMDRRAAVTGGSGSCLQTGLVAHMDRALSQGANLFLVVIYDMPNRDCSSTGSNGELLIAQDGVNIYKTEYIDPIVAIFKDAKYANLRIVCIIEPDSLPNLVTNLSKAPCQEAESSGAYATCTQYAVQQIKSCGSNTYQYIDIAHDAWLGWDSNFAPAMDKIGNIVKNQSYGAAAIDGFVSNTANTLPFQEPFIPDGNYSVNGQPVKNSRFFDYNPYTGEKQFCDNWRSGMQSRGFSNIGMLVDTSRNGWGGPNRPTAASTSTDLNTWVDASRIDRRYHRGNWCNNKYAGIGARPQASPASGYDAFVWVKPPGESDGQSTSGSLDPCDPNKKLDQMCVPNGTNIYCSCGTNDALSGAPIAGGWFATLFSQLVANAYPPL
jgi:cellulose 1,4-beta-cellobiosidase